MDQTEADMIRIIIGALVIMAGIGSCGKGPRPDRTSPWPKPQQGSETEADKSADKSTLSTEKAQADSWSRPRTDERISQRQEMVRVIRDLYGVRSEKVLAAMEAVPRHWFVPDAQKTRAYDDRPLPIGFDQTISQPLIVAFMTDLLDLTADQKVLEIGTGSGYQAAVLNEFTPQVYSIEIVRPLAERTIGILKQRGYDSIRVKIGDGYLGWPEYAPYDAIIVTCAPDHIPQALKTQLRPGGRMVIPVGDSWSGQDLILIHKDADGNFRQESTMPVRFVPMLREE